MGSPSSGICLRSKNLESPVRGQSAFADFEVEAFTRGVVFHLVFVDGTDVEVFRLRVGEVETADGEAVESRQPITGQASGYANGVRVEALFQMALSGGVRLRDEE